MLVLQVEVMLLLLLELLLLLLNGTDHLLLIGW